MSSEKDALRNAVRTALKMMRDSGFEISGKLEVAVDPDLPFMGYSTQRAGGNIIVVAGMAVESGMIEGLLIHEMCHIYRTEQNHPSHNHKLLDTVGTHVIHVNNLIKDFQIKMIQQAVNHIQDLYADDLSFKVFEKSKLFPPEQAFAFFLDWINDTPVKSKSTKAKWLNIGIMLNNCFALSNMLRHNVKDVDTQAERKTEKFLSQTREQIKKEFTWFRSFMTNLPENPTEIQFEKDLTEYLTRTTVVANMS